MRRSDARHLVKAGFRLGVIKMGPLDLMWVGLGGGLGSGLRWWVGRLVGERYHGDFPLGTFLINISGADVLISPAMGYIAVVVGMKIGGPSH